MEVTNTSATMETLYYNKSYEDSVITSSNNDLVSISSTSYIKISYLIIGCVGILGNVFVVIVIGGSSALRTRLANIYILNQSMIDLCASVFLVSSTTIVDSAVEYPGVGGRLYCKLWLTKVWLWGFLVSSTYNLISLTLERYLAIVHPIWHKIFFNKSKAAVFLVGSWLFGVLYNIIYMVPTSVVIDKQCLVYSNWPNDATRKVFGVVTCVIQFFIPLGIQIYCYSRIIWVIRQKSKVAPVTQVTGRSSTVAGATKWSRAKQNTIKTLVLVSFCFVVCWSWNQVLFTMFNLGVPEDYSSNFYHFTVVAVFLNCTVNPIVYCLQYEQFQSAAWSMVCVKCRSGRTGFSATVSAVNSNITA